MKKSVLWLFAAVAVFCLAGFASAEISISKEGVSEYSKGDMLNIGVDITSAKSMSGFLTASLICGDKSNEVYKVPITIKIGEQKKVEAQISLEKAVIGELEGSCYVKAVYAGQEIKTDAFNIGSNVAMSLQGVSGEYNPGDTINVSGNAIKNNGQGLEGSVEFASELGVNFVQPVQSGGFAFDVLIPENAKAMSYNFSLKAYDQDYNGNVGNLGAINGSMIVRQILKSIDISLASDSLAPGNKLSYSVITLDQTGERMNLTAAIRIVGQNGEIWDGAVPSFEFFEFETLTNSAPGNWIIEASTDTLSASKVFVVQEYKHIDYILSNGTLNITNTGNVNYNESILIKIGNITVSRNLSLGPREEKSFELSAPDGEYDIFVSGSDGERALGRVALTGRAIGVEDSAGGPGSWLSWTLIIALFVIGGGLLIYYLKFKKKNYGGRSFKTPKISPLTPLKTEGIENGKRERAAVVVLKVRNSSLLSGNAQFDEVVSRINEKAREQKASISKTSDGITIVFSPTLIGGSDIALISTEFARDVSQKLEEFNRKFKNSVDYGVGVNEGALMVECKGGVFKYVSIGNTVALARKLAESAQKETLISDGVHSLTRAKVKVERAKEGWKITSLKDGSQYSDFIAKFKQRQPA